ncbi:conserved hypothetical protein [Ricinus communis]|uniref:RNase H type-1 domain-containing protein n=1 Tax=Ricinus communis TaxID=3988 RepID=B9SA88_RICCO|nr:conserved hypothetical protein [Ricinus communis]
MIIKGIQVDRLRGFKIKPHCPICWPSRQEAHMIKVILSANGKASGQRINKSKSEILFSPNIDTTTREAISGILNIKESESLKKYLGIPTSWERAKTRAFNFLVDRLSAKLQNWKGCPFSLSEREAEGKFFYQSPFIAEANALRDAVRNASVLKLPRMTCESNSLVVINCILGHMKEVPWEIKPTTEDIQVLMFSFSYCISKFVLCPSNAMADWILKFDQLDHNPSSICNAPDELERLLRQDVMFSALE